MPGTDHSGPATVAFDTSVAEPIPIASAISVGQSIGSTVTLGEPIGKSIREPVASSVGEPDGWLPNPGTDTIAFASADDVIARHGPGSLSGSGLFFCFI